MLINAYHVLLVCHSQLGLEFDRLPCLTLSILTCASAQRVPRMNVLKYDACCVRLSKIKAYPTRQSDLTSATHIFLGDVFSWAVSHHFAASRLRSTTFQRAKIHNLLALAGHSWQHLVWIKDVHTGTHADFPVELLVKQAAPRQRCDGKVGELQLQFWLRYQYAIQYMI